MQRTTVPIRADMSLGPKHHPYTGIFLYICISNKIRILPEKPLIGLILTNKDYDNKGGYGIYRYAKQANKIVR